MSMVEYTIKILQIDIDAGEIFVKLTPTEGNLTPITKRVTVPIHKVLELKSAESGAEMLTTLRAWIVSFDPMFQQEWNNYKVNQSLTLNPELLGAIGREFAPVTVAEVQAAGLPVGVPVVESESLEI
jgi:hypothetical protein